MKIILTIICLILFSSCKTKQSKDKLFIVPNTEISWYEIDSSTEKLKQKFREGHIEKFSINKASFRFEKDSIQLDVYNLQCLKNGKWSTNLTLKMPKYKNKFYLTNDFDLDNAFDLSFIEYGNNVIYFFDKEKQQFDSSPIKFSYDYAFLDSAKLIYGTNTQGSNTWNIDIFSISNRTMYHLLAIKIFMSTNRKNGSSEFTDALLYECNRGVKSDTTLIDTLHINKQYGDFSLRNFMKTMVKNRIYRLP